MNKMDAEKAMNELPIVLMYLSRFTDSNNFFEATDFNAWKGYNFDVLNELDEEDYIRQGNRPSLTKSVYITETGIEYAKELMEKYKKIGSWKNE